LLEYNHVLALIADKKKASVEAFFLSAIRAF